MPLWKLTRNGGSESRRDLGNAVDQRVIERPGFCERSTHDTDDQTRDDDVLERHHAVVVRAQTLQRFRGFDGILQHTRNFLLLVERLQWLRTSQPLMGKNLLPNWAKHIELGCPYIFGMQISRMRFSL